MQMSCRTTNLRVEQKTKTEDLIEQYDFSLLNPPRSRLTVILDQESAMYLSALTIDLNITGKGRDQLSINPDVK